MIYWYMNESSEYKLLDYSYELPSLFPFGSGRETELAEECLQELEAHALDPVACMEVNYPEYWKEASDSELEYLLNDFVEFVNADLLGSLEIEVENVAVDN